MQFNSFVYILFSCRSSSPAISCSGCRSSARSCCSSRSCVFYGWEHPWYLAADVLHGLPRLFRQPAYRCDERRGRRRPLLVFSIIIKSGVDGASSNTPAGRANRLMLLSLPISASTLADLAPRGAAAAGRVVLYLRKHLLHGRRLPARIQAAPQPARLPVLHRLLSSSRRRADPARQRPAAAPRGVSRDRVGGECQPRALLHRLGPVPEDRRRRQLRRPGRDHRENARQDTSAAPGAGSFSRMPSRSRSMAISPHTR